MKTPLVRETETAPAFRRIRATRLLAACALVFAQGAWTALAAGPQVVSGTVPPAAASATFVRPTLRLEKLNLSIGLPLRNREALTNLLRDIYNPASPNFHHYLTSQQFAEQFGPTQSDYDAVIHFANAHGLKVVSTHSNRMVVGVKGMVGDINRAFHITLNDYKHPTENRNFHAPSADPTLNLGVPIQTIAGLDNFMIPHPCAKLEPTGSLRLRTGSDGKPQAGSAPGGAFYSTDFRAAYAPGVTQTGVGQSVGLFELQSGYYQSDITAYETSNSLPNVPIIPVSVDEYNGGPGIGNSEVSLDIEMAIGMAPGLNSVLVYEGNVADDILSQMASDNTAKQLSASWTYTTDGTTEDLFMQFATQGQSFFNAAGDGDATVGAPAPPTDDPNITIVGGTELTTTAGLGTWTGETVWNEGSGDGTGGGISTRWSIPVWQQNVSMALNQGSQTMRNFPDVAMCSYDAFVCYSNGVTGAFVGTSIGTPSWAAYIACVNQLAIANSEPTVGFINPAIYNMGLGLNAVSYTNLFHDITSGNNEDTASPNLFVAAVGYDLCTGWGSPAGTNLVYALALPEPLRITPLISEGMLFSGPVGGPFTPLTQTYTLTNDGTGTIDWEISSTLPTWLDLSSQSGALTSGGSATPLGVSIDHSANSLTTGLYTTSLSFTDENDAFVQSPKITLSVYSTPVITSQPTNEAVLENAKAFFNVGIATNGLVSYQWQFDTTNLTDKGTISGSATANLTVSSVVTSNVGTYSVIVSDLAGTAVSSNATLSIVSSEPVVSQQPSNTTVLPGDSATFTVEAVGNTPYTYHWMFNSTPLANGTKYSGVTNATLVISNTATTNIGNYAVIVSNSLGAVTSSNAMLSLISVTTGGFGLNVPASFAGGASVANPYSGLVYDTAQSVYFGTCAYGGANGGGCTYKVTAAGAVTKLHTFAGGTDGYIPLAPMCLAKDGNLYGASYEYATYSDGSLWRQSPTSATLTGIVQFEGENGSGPWGGLMQASDNNLYGTANAGGDYGYGAIFRCVSTNGATNLTVMTSFDGEDGAFPSPILVQSLDGNLYGTTQNGGTNDDAGTIFSISLSGYFTSLYSFNGVSDGAVPVAGLTVGSDGNLYGTTLEGGQNNFGTVFQFKPASGTLTTLYSFTGASDGAEPWGGLVQASDGNLYGNTQEGGTYGDGVVFQIAPTGTLNAIAQFDGYQGENPEGNLVQGPDGNLYGTTFQGGDFNVGTFFSVILTNNGSLQIDGQPAGLTVDAGATAIFAVATTGGVPLSYQWQLNNINVANGANIAGATSATLTLSDVTTNEIGNYTVTVSNSFGPVVSQSAYLNVQVEGPDITSEPDSQTNVVGSTVFFTVTATGDQPLSYRWQFNGTNLTDGGNVTGSATDALTLANLAVSNTGNYMVNVSNTITVVPSSVAALTVVPQTTSSASVSNLHTFAGGTADGANPASTLIQGLDGNLYGTAAAGGSNYAGTIFRSSLSGTLSNLYNFTTANGAYPYGGLIQAANSNFFGTTSGAGSNAVGSLFSVTNSATVTYLHEFTGAPDGGEPEDSLVLASDGNFYGTTFEGGTNNGGTVFRTTTSGTVTVLYSFTGGGDGGNPNAGLIQGSDGNLYGTTTADGEYGFGTMFNINPISGQFTTLVVFNDFLGGGCYGGLIQATNGLYYGTTTVGGDYGGGTVFEWSAGTGLTTLAAFDGTNGAFPLASLIQGTDGNLYGTTSGYGLGGEGTVFKITTNGDLTTLLWFDGYNGADPQSALVQANDGNFYGAAATGGTGYDPTSGGGLGTIFRVTVPLFIKIAFAEATAVVGLPYSGTISNQAVTPAGDTLTFARVSGPVWLTVAANGGLSGAPANANIGTNLFQVSLTDTNSVTATATMTVPVIADPPPTFLSNSITGAPGTAGVAYSGSISNSATTAYLSEGDVLTFGLVSGPSWLHVATNGLLSGTPGGANLGSNTFVVGVTNLGGGSAEATLHIYVYPEPPTILTAQVTNTAGVFKFSFSGPLGQPYQVLATGNLDLQVSAWSVVAFGNFGSTNAVFSVTTSPSTPLQFYTVKSP